MYIYIYIYDNVYLYIFVYMCYICRYVYIATTLTTPSAHVHGMSCGQGSCPDQFHRYQTCDLGFCHSKIALSMKVLAGLLAYVHELCVIDDTAGVENSWQEKKQNIFTHAIAQHRCCCPRCNPCLDKIHHVVGHTQKGE